MTRYFTNIHQAARYRLSVRPHSFPYSAQVSWLWTRSGFVEYLAVNSLTSWIGIRGSIRECLDPCGYTIRTVSIRIYKGLTTCTKSFFINTSQNQSLKSPLFSFQANQQTLHSSPLLPPPISLSLPRNLSKCDPILPFSFRSPPSSSPLP